MKMTGLVLLVVMVFAFSTVLFADDKGRTGEELFGQFCAPCHPKGGNILDSKKTLSRKDREENGVRTFEDILKKIRNPGAFNFHPSKWSGMKIFDEKTLPDEDAGKIATYVIDTFQ